VEGPGPEHARLEDVEEHGRLWQVCGDCSGQWDAQGEQVTEGDGSCLDLAVAAEYGDGESCSEYQNARNR
jgi:hypothetical protein